MKLLYLENYEDFNDYQEFYRAEILFVDNFGWREVNWLTNNLCAVYPKSVPVYKYVTT